MAKLFTKTSCWIEYQAYREGKEGPVVIQEHFPAIPDGTYSQLGYHDDEQGLLFFRRLTIHGTALVPILSMDGKHLRCFDEASFGKTLKGGKWENE